MEIFPKTTGTRPRLACELRPGGVVAARAEDAAGVIDGIGGAEFAAGALAPGLRAGSLVDRVAVVEAVRRALEAAGANGSYRGKDVTLIVPDAAVRVILLDFDVLPGKLSEAMPVVRFRLKKLVPFEVDDGAVSYQVMSSERGMVRVLAVAMPGEVLAEYESAVREAGFEPGAVLPSTLAALAGVAETEASLLAVNASAAAVTTAIVQSGVVVLHRSVDMQADVAAGPAIQSHAASAEELDRDPVGYGDPIAAEATMQSAELERMEAREQAASTAEVEIAQAVSVAAAYFEDSLGFRPESFLVAGTMGADAMGGMMAETGMKAREMVDPEAIAAGAATASVRRGLLAGVRGALRG